MNKESTEQCLAQTKAAVRCKNRAMPRSKYCHIHQTKTSDSTHDISETGAPVNSTTSDRELRRELMKELDDLILRVQAISPDYSPPPFSSDELVAVLNEEGLDKEPGFGSSLLRRLRGTISEDLLDIETWKGIWYMVNYTIEYQSDILKRRIKGDYETDPWGLDWEFLEAVRPFLDFMYKYYWRVETTGIENIPDYESAIIVSNHSGQFPWDGAMIMTAALNEHPAQRLIRFLYSEWFPTIPFISSFLVKMGHVMGSSENGDRLLEQGEVIGVFPEGLNSLGKSFRGRYQLSRFRHSGFAKLALDIQRPIIPVSVVGGEETYISLGKSTTLARMFGVPYFPISMRFPWLGLAGLIPLPSKWYIDIGQRIDVNGFDQVAASESARVSILADQVRDSIQEMVNMRLEKRESIYF